MREIEVRRRADLNGPGAQKLTRVLIYWRVVFAWLGMLVIARAIRTAHVDLVRCDDRDLKHVGLDRSQILVVLEVVERRNAAYSTARFRLSLRRLMARCGYLHNSASSEAQEKAAEAYA